MFRKLSYYLPGVGESWLLVLLLLVGNFVGSALTLALSMLFASSVPAEEFVLYFSPVAYVIMMLFPILFAIGRGKKGMLKNSLHSARNIAVDSNHFGQTGWVLSALLLALITICASLVMDPLSSIMPEPWAWVKESLETLIKGPKYIARISTVVLAPLLEELLCRGIILRGLLKHTSSFMAIFWSALIFAVIHLNPFQALPAFLLGILMGWVYYKTGSLKLTILIHFTNNLLSLLISWNFPMTMTDSLMDILPADIYWYSVGGGAVVLIGSLIILGYGWKGMNIIRNNRR